MAVQQSEHQKKYDRQMRLWGGHGQQKLENAKICVLGSNCVASETLKNCVLPNIGQFTMIDDSKVSIEDCGNNFFVTQDDIGKNRAEVVTQWLLEMNPDSTGSAINRNINDLIDKELNFFDKFDIVISTQMQGANHKKLADYCYNKNIAYVNVRINGFLSYIRVQFNELCIMESHPTNDRTDLFLYPDQLKNFKELQEYIDSFDLKTNDMEKRAHTPCISILGKYTKEYLAAHNGKLPSNFKERQEFKDEIAAMGNGENIADAVEWASQCYLKPRIDREVQQVLNDPNGAKLNEKSKDFWILVRSLKDFMANEGNGFMPCSTNIPDITADSKSYVKLKQIYKERSLRDLKIIENYVKKNLSSIKRDPNSIPFEIIERFVKNSRCLRVVRTKSITEEYKSPNMEDFEELYMDFNFETENDENEAKKPLQPKMINWYWTFRACEVFFDENGRLPGAKAETIEEDIKKLVVIQEKLFKDIKLEQEIVEACLAEICRFGGSEIHNIAAMIGGVCSQAILKIILEQFYPFSHTMVFNGIHCEANVFSF